MSNHYCDSIELEEWWDGWIATSIHTTKDYIDKKGNQRKRINIIKDGDSRNWNKMSSMLYEICLGIAKKFRPKDDDVYHDLANEAAVVLLNKIKSGKLRPTPRCEGGSPFFNLVTTTVQRQLCSYKNNQRDSKKRHAKYVTKIVQEQAPELMSSIKDLYNIEK